MRDRKETSSRYSQGTAAESRETRVLIVTGVRLFREGLTQILDRRDGLAVVASARQRDELFDQIRELKPQIILLDVSDSESHLLAREIGNLDPPIPVVALGVPDAEGDVIACAEAGIAEYVT